jgi:hypothetical protein
MTEQRQTRSSAPGTDTGLPPGRLLVVVRNSSDGMRVAEHAGRLAASLPASLTVALILRPPAALALAAHAFVAYYPLDDVEIDVMLHLSRVLDPLGVPWRLEPVTGDPSATVARLASEEPVRWVLVGRERPRWPGYTPWLARTLRRRYRLPVLVVTPGRVEHRKEQAS